MTELRPPTPDELRAAGFTTNSTDPRDALALKLLCAFNGVSPDIAPAGWRNHANASTREAWARVADVVEREAASRASPLPPDDVAIKAMKIALCSVPQLFLRSPAPKLWQVCRWGNADEAREVVLEDSIRSQQMAEFRRDRLILELRARAALAALKEMMG